MLVTPVGLIAIALGSLVASTITRLAGRRAGADPDTTEPAWWGSWGLALGFGIAQLGVALPDFPPLDVHDRIPYLALGGAVAGSILTRKRDRWWSRGLAGFIVSGLVLFAMLGPYLQAGDQPEEDVESLVTLAIVTVLALMNIGLLDAPAQRREVTLGLTLLAAASSVVLILANNVVLALLSVSLAVVLAASLLGTWGRGLANVVPVASAVLAALLVEGSVYAFLKPAPALTLALAPLTLWLTRLGPIQKLGNGPRYVVVALLVSIPAVVAIVLAWQSRALDGYGI